MTRALLCSGQGRLARNMFDMVKSGPAALPILAAANDLLGADPLALLASADTDTLLENRTSQVLSISRTLCSHAALGLRGPALVAGYSVGEMAAWSIAGLWAPEQALRLTARRAELMDAADGDAGGLGFVRGLDAGQLMRLLDAHHCAIAIRNPGNMEIIGGKRTAVMAFCADALAHGAAGARPIPVHVASHTPRLEAAVAPFLSVLAAETLSSPSDQFVLIGAADAMAIASGAAALPGLARQLATTIDWTRVLQTLVERGARRFLELGPGDALADMVRGAWPELEARSLDDFRTMEGAATWFEAA